MAISEIILSIGEDVVKDVVNKIYVDKTLVSTLQKELKKAILKSVEVELPNAQDKELRQAIADDIFYACGQNNIQNLSLERVVKRTLKDYFDENKDSQMITKGIISNLPLEIIRSRELNALIDSKFIFAIFQQNVELMGEVIGLKKDINVVKYENKATRELLMEVLTINQEQVLLEKNKRINNKYIPEKYKTYFLKTLFLESSINDIEQATLKDVYISPHFVIMDQEKTCGTDIKCFIEDFVGRVRKKRSERSIYNFADKNISTLFIKGHAGSGKSSLFYHLAHEKSNNSDFLPNYKMIFIKLIELYKESNNRLSEDNPLEDILTYTGLEGSDLANALIVLDGLDEICTAKDINIYEYCNNLIESTFRFDNLKIIITTRLNYINITHKENKNVLNIKLKNWEISDLINWCEQYFAVHKEATELYKKAKENIQYLSKTPSDEIMNIIAVPLLFYMITAIGLKLDSLHSIGQLYDQVFEQLYTRNYNENSNSALQRCGIIRAIPKALSRQIAMEIAYKMYQENELLLKLNSTELKQAIQNAYENSEDIELNIYNKRQIEKLFPITFFYKEIYDVVEFAHKSIMEFFCAEKMFMELKLNKPNISEFIINHMIHNAITTDIMQFFIYFIETRQSEINLEDYKREVEEAFWNIILSGDLGGKINKRAYGYEVSKLIFRVYWIFIKEILKCDIDVVNNILSSEYTKNYMIGVLGVRKSDNLPFICNNIYRWNFDKCQFVDYCFDYVDLSYSDFTNAAFYMCSFQNTNLSNSTFLSCKVRGRLDLSFASLENCLLDNILCAEEVENNNSLVNKNSNVVMKHAKVKDTIIRKCDLSKWNIDEFIYLGKLSLIKVVIHFKQFEKLCMNNVNLRDIKISVDESLFTIDDKNQFIRLHTELMKTHELSRWDEILENNIDVLVNTWEKKYENILKRCSEYQITFDMAEMKTYVNKRLI